MSTRIHYSGDMCNAPGWFTATDHPTVPGVLRLTEEAGGEGRVLTVRDYEVGDVYAGHCSPRFVTEAAVRAFRASRGA